LAAAGVAFDPAAIIFTSSSRTFGPLALKEQVKPASLIALAIAFWLSALSPAT